MEERRFNPTLVTFNGQNDNVYTRRAVKNRWEQLAIEIQSILREFAVPVPETLQGIESKYIDFLRESGVVTNQVLSPVLFINPKDIPAINAKLSRLGTAVVPDSLGFSSIMFGNVVILEEGYSDITFAYTLAEELFHSLGEQVIAYNPVQEQYSRRGFDLSTAERGQYGWFLEEAIAKYYSYQFLKRLEKEGFFKQDFDRLQKKIEYFRSKGRFRNNKVIFPDMAFYADPYHLLLINREEDGQPRDVLSLQSPDTVAADVFLDLVTRLDNSARKKLLDTLNRARQDHTHILEAARLLDTYFGKGTYSALMKCDRTFEAVFVVRNMVTS